MYNKFIIAGVLFVLIILSGFWLSRTGRPLNTAILTVHKLLALGAGVYLAITIYRLHQAAPLGPLEMAVSLVTLAFFLALIATGGMLSAAKTVPALVQRAHQVIPFMVILSSAASMYLVLVRRVIAL
jgi:hypothetical protein